VHSGHPICWKAVFLRPLKHFASAISIADRTPEAVDLYGNAIQMEISEQSKHVTLKYINMALIK
jgi:hypothetical protein